MSSPFTYSSLATEITSDPMGLGYAGQNSVQIASLVNTPGNLLATPKTGTGWTKPQPLVPIATLAQWAATPDNSTGTTPIDLVTTASTNAGLSSEIRGAALMAARLFNGAFDSFDVSNTANQALLDVLVGASPSLVTSAQSAALMALGVTPCSRAEFLWGVGFIVSPDQVQIAGHW